jgi:quercetin dioxygenase-like cupin family protein
MSSETFITNLTGDMVDIPVDSIVSRTLLGNANLKTVLFGFAPGQELSAHTAFMPAVIHILAGEGTLKLGETTHDVTAGAWAYMPAGLNHALKAKTEVRMLLLLLRGGKEG